MAKPVLVAEGLWLVDFDCLGAEAQEERDDWPWKLLRRKREGQVAVEAVCSLKVTGVWGALVGRSMVAQVDAR